MEKITSRRNPLCVHIKKLGADRGYSKQCGEFLCDGLKLLAEAIKCNADISVVLTSESIPFPMPLDTRLYYAERSLIDSLSPLKNAQDTIFVCKTPRIAETTINSGIHLLLDGVQDPGNVGTMIRTADAFGIDSVMLTDDCANPHNPKTIRATMGAIFRQDIYHINNDELEALKSGGIRIIGAALSDGCRDFSEVGYNNSIIAIGSEGSGLSEKVLSLCDEKIRIPISPKCESLNAAVAAGIILQFAANGRY